MQSSNTRSSSGSTRGRPKKIVQKDSEPSTSAPSMLAGITEVSASLIFETAANRMEVQFFIVALSLFGPPESIMQTMHWYYYSGRYILERINY